MSSAAAIPQSSSPENHFAFSSTASAGDASTSEAVWNSRTYGTLRRSAQRLLSLERADHTLSPTALIHEAWLQQRQRGVQWNDSFHAVRALILQMRRLLIDHGRAKRAARRRPKTPVMTRATMSAEQSLAEVERVLEKLAAVDERLAEVAACLLLDRLSAVEAAERLGVSPRTISRDWAIARAWLRVHCLRYSSSVSSIPKVQ